MRNSLEAALALALWAAMPAHGAGMALIVQSSPLAGSQFYRGRVLWQDMRVGDALELVREPDNAHDPNAVRVLWRGEMLGYVPRHENAHVARQLDRGARLHARVVRLTAHRNPWMRMAFEVYAEL